MAAESRPAIRTPFKIMGGLIIAAFVLAAFASCTDDSPATQAKQADADTARSATESRDTTKPFTLQKTYVACFKKEDEAQLVKIAGENDHDAFTSFVTQSVENNACAVITPGTVVHLEDTAVFDGLVELRPQGQPTPLWFPIDTTNKDG